MYNVYEAYLYKFRQFIFVLSYSPGIDIKSIIDDIALPFNFRIIKLENIKDSDDFDYNKLSNDVNKILNENKLTINGDGPIHNIKGILIYGLNFPVKSLFFKVDIQYHLSLSKKLYFKFNNDDKYEYYSKIVESNKINKYFNIKEEINKNINDQIYDKLIEFIEKKVYGKNYEKLSLTYNKNNNSLKSKNNIVDTNNSITDSEIISDSDSDIQEKDSSELLFDDNNFNDIESSDFISTNESLE